MIASLSWQKRPCSAYVAVGTPKTDTIRRKWLCPSQWKSSSSLFMSFKWRGGSTRFEEGTPNRSSLCCKWEANPNTLATFFFQSIKIVFFRSRLKNILPPIGGWNILWLFSDYREKYFRLTMFRVIRYTVRCPEIHQIAFSAVLLSNWVVFPLRKTEIWLSFSPRLMYSIDFYISSIHKNSQSRACS